MRKKGQVEFIVILGIIVVVAIVIVLALQGPGTGPLPADSRTVKESVEGFIRAGTYNAIKDMGLQGGYVAPAANYVTFLGKPVAYWQKDGQIMTPDLSTNLVEALEQYIRENKDSLASSFDKPVTLGDPQVSASVLASKVELVVHLPTTVDGSPIPQPYTVSVPTKLGEINEFGRGFVSANNEKRFFETFTLASMVISPFNDGVQQTPTLVFLAECGEFVFKSWWDMQPDMTDVIERTIANTYMPGKGPRDVGETTSSPKYLLTPINGKNYGDIEVGFYLPDDFELTRQNFAFTPDPVNAFARPIPMTGICQSDPINVNYYVKYPVIVRVEDPLTNNAFQFAIDVAIQDNGPAAWAGLSGYEPTELSQLCSNPQCRIRVTIKDGAGDPVPYASATFLDCPVGRADENGVLDASVPCGIGKLNIYNRGHDVYDEIKSSDGLADASVTLTKAPIVNLHLYEVVIDDVSSIGEYWIKEGAIKPIDNNIRDSAVWLTVFEHASHQNHEFVFTESAGRLVGVPAGTQAFSAILYENLGSASMSVTGVMADNFALKEGMDGGDLYVYVPYYPDIDLTAGDVNVAQEAAKLTNILRKCGIGPISETEVAGDTTCTLSHSDALVIG